VVHIPPRVGGLSIQFKGAVSVEVRAVGLASLACRVYQFQDESGVPLTDAFIRGTATTEGKYFWARAINACRGLLRVGGSLSLHEWMLLHVPCFQEFRPGRLELITSSAAMLPPEGRSRLRMLEALGDAAITRRLARVCLDRGDTAGEYQDVRSRSTSNTALAALFVNNFDGMVTFVAGVSPSSGVGAKALEAIVGALDEAYGDDAVATVLRVLGFTS